MKQAIGVAIAMLLMLSARAEAKSLPSPPENGSSQTAQRPVEEISIEQYPNLRAALAAIGATARSLTISSAQSVSTSLVIPANVALRITGGGQVVVPVGVILTINGAFEAPLRQVFTGGGAVRWGSHVATVYPQWWGAKMDGVTDDHGAIQAAIDSFKTHTGTNLVHAGIVEITGGARIDSTLLIEFNAITLRGQGW
jgi:hypothetical protein